ncbi:WD-40 repeat protein [Aphelenchoides besseyi]|nr:WD-40 repeat protein [Aphelenchoides besseyi]KAI6232168.1 WD-40 repeat protein [Aphelenchoides besseyi]
MELVKRNALDDFADDSYGKRMRYDVAVRGDGVNGSGRPRQSNLQEPIMLLTGHEGEIFTSRFSPDGTCLASAGYDQRIFLWNVYGECENFSTLRGHSGAVMDVFFSTDCNYLFSCATDKTVRIWDMETGNCVRKYKSHNDIVNSCHPARRGPTVIVSGSDDGTILIHDIRTKDPVQKFVNLYGYQVTAVTFNDTAERIISAGIDNTLKMWDTRQGLVHTFFGHQDTITGVALSPDGRHVLSNSMDCTAKIWDVQPFSNQDRCVRTLVGHQHNFEKNLLKCAWSPDGKRVSVGSSDRLTYIWSVGTGKIEYGLPGHQGSVNAVDFHPIEPLLLSGGSDKKIFLGELEPSTEITSGL